MRVLAVSALVLALAVAGAAAECVRPASNLYPMTSACPAFAACGASFCSCVGATGNMNASTCLGNAPTATCASISSCLAAQQSCIAAIAAASTNSSSPCFMLGSSIQVAAVAAATGGYANSTLQKSCQYSVCTAMNASALTTCNFGVADANVCMMPSVAPTPAPTAPTGTLPANFAAAIVAQLRIQGAAFEALLRDNYAGLAAAVRLDLAGLLQISASDIVITNMVLGSLIVTFAVGASAGVQPSVLNDRLQTATTANWLTSTQGVYSTVSNETLRVTSAPALLSTAAPGAVTSGAPTTAAAGTTAVVPVATPPATSPSAAVVSVLASVIAVAAAVVAL
jgi:hypothetical protein